MSLSYTIRESVSGFRRAKLSSALAVLTVWIALVLLGLFALASINTQRFVGVLRERMEMDAFLRQPVAGADIAGIEQSIRAVPGVRSTMYISKDDAARIFQQEFGEDIYRVLDFNPLPPSFRVQLRSEFITAPRAALIHHQLSAIAGIDTVVYRKTLLEMLDTRTAAIYRVALGLGIFVALSAILLVANTIRLAIYAKRHIVRTMELVGATQMFVKMPFLLEGMLQGLLGGLLAAGVLHVSVEYLLGLLAPDIASFVHMPPLFYLGVATAGVLLGFLGSALSVGRFLRRTA